MIPRRNLPDTYLPMFRVRKKPFRNFPEGLIFFSTLDSLPAVGREFNPHTNSPLERNRTSISGFGGLCPIH